MILSILFASYSDVKYPEALCQDVWGEIVKYSKLKDLGALQLVSSFLEKVVTREFYNIFQNVDRVDAIWKNEDNKFHVLVSSKEFFIKECAFSNFLEYLSNEAHLHFINFSHDVPINNVSFKNMTLQEALILPSFINLSSLELIYPKGDRKALISWIKAFKSLKRLKIQDNFNQEELNLFSKALPLSLHYLDICVDKDHGLPENVDVLSSSLLNIRGLETLFLSLRCTNITSIEVLGSFLGPGELKKLRYVNITFSEKCTDYEKLMNYFGGYVCKIEKVLQTIKFEAPVDDKDF